MSIPPPLDAAPEQRLHPWSWLFVLLMQLRQGLVPLIALVVFGQRGDRDEFWLSIGPVIAVVVLVAYSVLQYLTYRYRIGATAITVRSGVFARNRREIPFARIHNVVVHQNPLHRLFGVAELKLESAGGNRPEAEMRVLKLDQALALERLVRIGLLSNRGWVVVVALLGAMLQLFPRGSVSDVIEAGGRQAFGYASHLHPGMWLWAIAAVLAVAGFWVLLRVLSVVLALLRYYGFRLSEHERRLTVASGLLTRMRTSVARRRIQAWTLRETALQRWFQRRQLRIDIAAGNPGEGERRDLRELAPLATPAVCDGLVQHLLPHLQWPPARWQPVQRRGWWRLCLGALCVVPLLSAGAIWYGGPWGALLLLWLPWSAFRAHRQMDRIGYHLDDDYVAVRGGWWQRWWRFAELDKLQALRLTRSPLDRRLGTASVWLDTAGAGMGTPLVLQYLPEAEARAVYEQLGRALAKRRLRW